MKSIKRKRNMKISLVLDMQVPYIVDIDSNLWFKKSLKIIWNDFSHNAKELVQEFTYENSAQGIINASKYASK